MKIEEVIHETHRHIVFRFIKEASFDEWLTYLFDRPDSGGPGKHWSFDEDDSAPGWGLEDQDTVRFMTRTYEDPGYWIRKFSMNQIADGLAYTWNPSLSNLGHLLRDEIIPWDLRRRAIRSLVPLYEGCFQKLCDPGLSHLGEFASNPLNGVCYMYWDVCPGLAHPEKPENHDIDAECLGVMAATLQIDHDACRESALHGLGHWWHAYPSRVRSIIEDGLRAGRRHIRPELLNYAADASEGAVQ